MFLALGALISTSAKPCCGEEREKQHWKYGRGGEREGEGERGRGGGREERGKEGGRERER